MAATKPYKFPKSIGACADKLWTLRLSRLKLSKEADAIETEEKALKLHIINTLPKSEASGVSGKLCTVTSVSKEIPQVNDWDTFYKFVKKTGQFDLMSIKLSDTAVKQRWEGGKEVPGVTHFKVTSLSVTKV